ncbi:hypothetical protein [Mucilaginibacter ginsenosidivorans]|uniref:LemA family protein n=1 Tax=Mucilaginibacter ginsenosidivorans TaxID=398053 RepID=A0A5B8UWP1_9SPHI|nr:hypothetical protein [Mucilaginibacter ginsenosidivorans]QEC63383.1 hypothetical protein FRZ54_12620 [Mucilaginibacter ginsenosidivorans]
MNVVILFLVVGFAVIYLIARYDKQNSNKVDVILRANKNVPPLFMLRSAELKVNAIKAALSNPAMELVDQQGAKEVRAQFDQLMDDYKNREITLAIYYTRLGALLIKVNELRGVSDGVEVS